ncbi:NAD-dependent epimerase/dehydratase family protein [Streptosporangium roseum]|uniref:NAD-dependent epimerase/dehydratase family protein n=1 Tax=Streptosporangium roseum TaxID=2001 RepID=UPI0033336BC8
MRVFVAGGTGVLGRRLVPQLMARSHQVTATTTSAAKLGLVEQLGAEAVVMDGLDAVSVGEAVAQARPGMIVHQMTAISGKPDIKHFDRWFATTNQLRTEGTDHLLAAAQATGVTGFVAQSYAAWNGIREGGWVKTEEDPLDAASATVLAVELKARGVFNIVDDVPAPANQWLPYLAACAGAKPPMRVPTWLARPLAGRTAVTMMTEGRGFSNAKAKRELGRQPRYPSWRQGFKDELA